MSFFETIGRGIDAFCSLVWEGLKAIWEGIKKVLSIILDWTISIVKWLAKAALGLAAGIVAGIIVFFIWIFGPDDDNELDNPTPGEETLEKELKKRFADPNKKIITVKGVFNKNTGEIHKNTEIEASNSIDSSVLKQTGGSRFAELQGE